jgi:hypothetical protein
MSGPKWRPRPVSRRHWTQSTVHYFRRLCCHHPTHKPHPDLHPSHPLPSTQGTTPDRSDSLYALPLRSHLVGRGRRLQHSRLYRCDLQFVRELGHLCAFPALRPICRAERILRRGDVSVNAEQRHRWQTGRPELAKMDLDHGVSVSHHHADFDSDPGGYRGRRNLLLVVAEASIRTSLVANRPHGRRSVGRQCDHSVLQAGEKRGEASSRIVEDDLLQSFRLFAFDPKCKYPSLGYPIEGNTNKSVPAKKSRRPDGT